MTHLSKLLSASSLVLVGCSSLSGLRRTSPTGPVVRDVPLNVRAADESPRNRVLILPFLDERPNGGVGDAARPQVVRDLQRSGQFVVLNAEDVPQDPKRFLTELNEYDLSPIAKQSAALGIAAVVEGKVLEVRIKRLGDTLGLIREAKVHVAAKIRVRVYGGKSGKEIFNDVRSAEAEVTATLLGPIDGQTSLRDDPELTRVAVARAFQAAAPDVIRAVDKLGWEGRVAMISGERVFINAGRLTGLQVGDVLKITEEGDDIYDPETGRFVGTAPGRLKGTVEVVSYFGKDGAIAVIHSGAGFLENDHVELY